MLTEREIESGEWTLVDRETKVESTVIHREGRYTLHVVKETMTYKQATTNSTERVERIKSYYVKDTFTGSGMYEENTMAQSLRRMHDLRRNEWQTARRSIVNKMFDIKCTLGDRDALEIKKKRSSAATKWATSYDPSVLILQDGFVTRRTF